MSSVADRVWALHDFEAENPDEVSFKAGECILVVEKDDEYGDGWWQGTNEQGETGLFPYTYTTTDKNIGLSAKAGNLTPDALGTPQGAGSNKPGVMHSTMADIDNALTELQGDRNGAVPPRMDTADTSRASFTSEHTDGEESDNFGESDGFATQAVAARAALAANAQRDLADANEKEKLEEQRRRAEAQRHFEEEEARQRALLLEKEKERQAKVAAGQLDPSDEKPKVAPIAGVDMSDESDSEGSIGDLDDFEGKTHSPLFGNLSATPEEGVASRELGGWNSNINNSSLQGIIENEIASQGDIDETHERPNGKSLSEDRTSNLSGTTNAAAPATSSVAAVDPAVSVPLTSRDYASAAPDPTANSDSSVQPTTDTVSHAAPALAAGAGAIAVGAAAASAAATKSSHSTPAAFVQESTPPAMGTNSAAPELGDSARAGSASIAGDSTVAGTGTAPTSIAATGTETPGSTGRDSSRATSLAAAAKPTGDPTEWSVDQVVDWARSKGWDEAGVVSKFKEHEISGDVLLEMDINILKEIEINAFGKRFQVANGIKELRKQVPGASMDVSTPAQADGLGSPAIIAPGTPAAMSPAPTQAPYTPGSHMSRDGSNADGRSLNARMAETSIDQSTVPNSSRPNSVTTGDHREPFSVGAPAAAGAMAAGFGGAAGVAAWQAHQAGHGPRVMSEGYNRGSGDAPMSPAAAAQFNNSSLGPNSRYSTRSNDDKLGALPSSPRKRESTGSGGGPVKENNRSSFFGLGPRNRKPPPASASSVGSSAFDDEKGSKGTLSRLGFSRSSRNVVPQSSQSNFKDQISLPTSSPQFDSTGDTARRSRFPSGAGVAGSPAAPGGMPSQARPTSIGSAGPDANQTAGAGAPPAAADGPVMARIQPVDLQGWIKKKGERYNSWKPRYLALKGPDLVILRDPQAEKIKGYVNMKGYKVIADENTNPGKYGFKILHESEKPHYFSSDDPILVREWMKALMKSTIGRDHSFPVISSYNNATISLKEAQRMNPPPRPPSPTSRARTQRAKVRPNPEQLTARDAAILMNLTSGQPTRADDLN